MKEAGWEEYIVISEVVWLPCSSFEGRAETLPATFGYLGVVRKKLHRVFHVRSSSQFPVAVASSTSRFLDWLRFNILISQEYYLNSSNLMQISWLVLGNVNVLCSWAHLRGIYAGWQMHAWEASSFCSWKNLGDNQLFPRTFVYLNLAASALFLSVSSLPTKSVSRDVIF